MTIADIRRVRAALDADWADLTAWAGPRGVPTAWWPHDEDARPATLDGWAQAAQARDDVVGATLRAAQDGDREAGRAMLHLLTARLTHLASRDAHHDLGDYVATAWLQVMAHPVATRPHALLTNLALDTLKRLSRDHARQHRLPPPPDPEPVESDLDASALIGAAMRAGWLPAASGPVLRSVYCDGLSGREAARRHHTSPEMVRYRCSAGIKALRAHRIELLAAA
jgi:DNA-directed RNA polymerase specialized sigma24 family protein